VIALPAFAEDPRVAAGCRRASAVASTVRGAAYRACPNWSLPLPCPAPERVGVFFANTRRVAYAQEMKLPV